MKASAGIILYKWTDKILQVFIVHPGGPFFQNKDAGSWTVCKGEIEEGEELLPTAIREFKEETGFYLNGEFLELGSIKMRSGKIVHAWALQHDLDATAIVSNVFEIEWPPKSKRLQSFPEIDRAGWFTPQEAIEKLNPAQAEFIGRLIERLDQTGK